MTKSNELADEMRRGRTMTKWHVQSDGADEGLRDITLNIDCQWPDEA